MSEYLHGSSVSERDRLSRMNAWLNERCIEIIKPQPGERVLDVGSGLGQLARSVARAGATVVGIERHDTQRTEAESLAEADGESGLVEFRAGNAMALDLPDAGSFDLAYCRFLLEHVPDPGAVVRGMARALKPGGRLILIDDDHEMLRFTPDCAPLDKCWRALIEGYRANNNDPDIGRKLVSLLHESGAQPCDNGLMFFGSCAGSDTWDLAWRNMIEVIDSSKQTMIDHGLLSAADMDAGIAAAETWAQLPDAAIWYGGCWAMGVKG